MATEKQKAHAWGVKLGESIVKSIANQRKTRRNPRKTHTPRRPELPLHPVHETNHMRAVEREKLRDQKIQLLNRMVAEVRENHPNERMPYREWKILAMTEIQAKIKQPV